MATLANPAFDLPIDSAFVYGESPAIRSVNEIVGQVLMTPIAVLLVGESGTGKEAYARLIHRLSSKARLEMRKVSCAASEPGQILSQVKSCLQPGEKNGEQDIGTLFLDGVDEIDLGWQRMLVSMLPDDGEDGAGEGRLRLISSSSINLEREMAVGRFRADLYFRINGVSLCLPPLRERREDIPEFIARFLTKHATEQRRRPPQISKGELELLVSYDWPGNIRELGNLAQKIVVLGNPGAVIAELAKRSQTVEPADQLTETSALKSAARAAARLAERQLIERALERTHWNRKRAAVELQISYKSLLYKIKQTGLAGIK